MKIGICCYPSYGGSGVVATELGIHLAKRGHEVHFITYDKPFRLGEYHPNVFYHVFETPNYPVFKHPPYIMALANKIYEVAKRESLDIIHAHYAVPHATAIFLAKQMLGGNIKTVTTLHGTDVTIMSEDPALREITEFSANSCDALTAVSEDLRKQTLKALDIKIPISTIYNFVDAKEYTRECTCDVRSAMKIGPDEKIMIHISNFRPVKRIKDVMEVFNGVLKEVSAHLLLVGDGPDIRIAYDFADQMNIRDRVHFLGKQNNVISLLSCSQLFLLPSEKESFGLAALEAMSCQVPVIATRTGGVPEVVIHGETGFLSDIGDVADMTKNAILLLKDAELHQQFAQRGRAHVTEHFNEQTIVDQYVELYQSLLDQK